MPVAPGLSEQCAGVDEYYFDVGVNAGGKMQQNGGLGAERGNKRNGSREFALDHACQQVPRVGSGVSPVQLVDPIVVCVAHDTFSRPGVLWRCSGMVTRPSAAGW